MNRVDFLGSLAATLATPVPSPAPAPIRAAGALVLSGGGARGAYEAGWIEGLRRTAGVGDGTPLPGIGVVCGTSIGAVNGWFVATAQYTRLAELWHEIASKNIFRLKHKYAATTNPRAFVLTKIIQALSLAQGLTKNVQGILDGGAVHDWLVQNIDDRSPLAMPYVFTVTNLDQRRPELFYRLPPSFPSSAPPVILDRLAHALAARIPVRLADATLFDSALQASTAIPALFDPIMMTSPEGTSDHFVDGGISDNNPIDVGRALADNVYLILCDPDGLQREPYDNVLEIIVGAFGVAQQRIFDAAIEAAREESEGRKLFDNDRSLTHAQRAFLDQTLAAELFVGRPAQQLPVEVAEMDRQEKINAAYAQGVADAQTGWAHL